MMEKQAADPLAAARDMLVLFYSFVAEVGKEIGTEKALELVKNLSERSGAQVGEMLKKQVEGDDCKAAWELMQILNKNLPRPMEVIEESPQKVSMRIGKCPMADASKITGLPVDVMCKNIFVPMTDAAIKAINPNLRIGVKYRTSPKEPCEEWIALD
jgi:hypothetical protein